jgi:4-amino-4-deoxy-L-arabinose transferase-like glycosyltransferase
VTGAAGAARGLGARPEERGRDAVILWSIVALALVLRVANSWITSLHLDDFHTLYHVRAPDLAEFFHRLKQDNHPPLSFLVVRLVRTLFGEDEFVLRIPAILYGVATVPVVWQIARRLPSRAARATAALFVGCSSLNLELSSDLRMYSLLTLALAGFLGAALDLLEQKRGFARCVLWTVVGLHTHYHFVHALAVIAGACVLVAWLHDELRQGLWRMLGALGVAAVLSLPWFALGFPAQLAHDLPPGGSEVSFGRLAEGLVHLVYLNLRLGGTGLRVVFLGAGAILLGLALLAATQLVVKERRGAASGTWLVILATAVLLPAWSALASWLMPRAGFEWRYIAGAVAPLALLTARGAYWPGPFARVRRIAVGAAIVAALVLCVINVRDPGRENNRDAVRAIVTRAAPGDAVVAAEWQPRLFPHSGAWNYYAPRLLPPGRELPHLVDFLPDFTFPPGTDFSPYRRVFFMGRSIPDHMPMLLDLRKQFPHETKELYGMSIWMLTFERD